MVRDMTCHDLKARLDDEHPIAVLDVREDWEIEICNINGAIHIPLSALAERTDELPRDVPLAVICHHGIRSRHAGVFLGKLGFKDVFNVVGGIDCWALEIEPAMSRYD
ncbi:sulfurtransferase [Thalassospira sp. MA62]|nr:sulfurtransferase [Thalassospira sp. MA62]